MYTESLDAVANAARFKSNLSKNRTLAYLVHSAMAGSYVGLGIVLIFALATPLFAAKVPAVGLVMGTTFGIALALVIISGSDLFTGNTMVMPVGALRGSVRWTDVLRVLAYSYVGNLMGSVLIAVCALRADLFGSDPSLVMAVAAKKMHGSFELLFIKGMLCNWLVVLAVWSCYRVKSEAAKLIMIWWCLLGFIGSGYEHSVANMTLLTLANLLSHDPQQISWAGWIQNLVPVTLGNIVSGAVFMGFAYHFIDGTQGAREASLNEPKIGKKAA